MVSTLVIIPNLNNKKVLEKCLKCLDMQESNDFDILVVDNGSDEETAEFIHFWLNKKDGRHAIFFDSNCGFAKACNRGFEYSMENGYLYSLLLNNDAFVEKYFVSNLINKIENDKKIFAVSSLMLSYQDRHVVDSFGDNYSVLGYAFQRKVGQPESVIENDESVFSACGGASIYDNEKLKETGLLDEKFFAYLEDIDLSYRAKLKGYKIITCKDARCYHLGSHTSGSRYNNFKVRISSRNNIFLIYKNMPLFQIIFNAMPLFLGTLVKFGFFLVNGFGIQYIQGIIDAFKNIENIDRNNFDKISPVRIILIEIELIMHTIEYIKDFLYRRGLAAEQK